MQKNLWKSWVELLAPAVVLLLMQGALTGLGVPKGAEAWLILPGLLLWYRARVHQKKKFHPPCTWRYGLGLISGGVCIALASGWISGPPEQVKLSVWQVTGYVLAGPVCEELVYRGAVLQRSQGLMGRLPGLLLSSALFAAGHSGPVQMAAAGVAGLLLGVICLGPGGILGAVFVHGLANLLSFWGGLYHLPEAVHGLSVAGLVLLAWYWCRLLQKRAS